MKSQTVTVSDVSVTFERLRDADSTGSSLWFEMPNCTNKKVAALFGRGAGMVSQDREKYSSKVYIKSSLTGNLYTLYKCYGEWRVGAKATHIFDGVALRALLDN